MNKTGDFQSLINELSKLMKTSESFRSLVCISAWLISFMTTLIITREMVYAILISTTALVLFGYPGSSDDDDD